MNSKPATSVFSRMSLLLVLFFLLLLGAPLSVSAQTPFYTNAVVGITGFTNEPVDAAGWFNRQVVTTNEWRAAAGLHKDRMIATNAQTAFTLYRTLWQRTNEQVLVCLQYPGLELFGTPYNVTVYDSKLQIIRRGDITAYQDDTPYCLAEVKSDDGNLPPELRGQWLFAVGFWENHFQEAMRLYEHKTNTVAMIKAKLADLPDEFYFELVHWEDAKVKPKYGAGNLVHVDDLQVRWIETGANVLSYARPEAGKPYRYSVPGKAGPRKAP